MFLCTDEPLPKNEPSIILRVVPSTKDYLYLVLKFEFGNVELFFEAKLCYT